MRYFPLFLVVALSTPGLPALAQEAATCHAEATASLDFWVGDWLFTDSIGNVVASSTVVAQNGNCLVRERRTGGGRELSSSTSYFDPANGTWRQLWLFEDGRIMQLEGAAADGALVLSGQVVANDGSARDATATLGTAADGSVRFSVQIDGEPGTFVLAFRRVDSIADDPAPTRVVATPPAVAPEPPAAAVPVREATTTESPEVEAVPSEPIGAVTKDLTIRSRETRTSLRRQIRAELESPAIFELRMGALHRMPPGYSWSSTETDGYLCNGAEIRRVTASPRTKRGRTLIDLTMRVFSRQMMQKVSVTAEIVHEGAVVAAQTDPNVSSGKSVTSNVGDGVPVEMTFEVTRETFDSMFTDDERPTLRLTVDCIPR